MTDIRAFFPLRPVDHATAAINVRGDATVQELVHRLENLAEDIAGPDDFPAIEIEVVGETPSRSRRHPLIWSLNTVNCWIAAHASSAFTATWAWPSPLTKTWV